MPKIKPSLYTSDPQSHYDWLIAPQVYLATALILTKRICPHAGMFQNEWVENNICKELGFRSAHPNYEFIWPMMFNLKHGIELYLKALGNIDHGEYHGSHDLKELFELLKSKSGQNKKIISELHAKAWPLVEKYYFGTYIPGNTSQGQPDKMNEVERFPESLKGNTYGIKDHFKWFKCDVISQVAEDIRKLESLFGQAQRDIDPQKKFTY